MPKKTGINEHAIKLVEDKQLSYRSIYSLSLIELKILKTYIKTNLVNGFIWHLKFLAEALIFFVHKLNNNFYLCVNYWDLNNLTMKIYYLLPLIGESLNQLGRTKRFI